ncbi:hypothetical protein E4U41_000895 [Claviceps citrina]|nr:hypothetical protein E4U41_000895 [Claviceps citrina]
MAMDALRNLATNIPDWQRRLDDLNGQIEHRQAMLAALAAGSFPITATAPTRSLRNKGSSESLKPKDDGPMHLDFRFRPGVPIPSRQHRAKRPAPPTTPSPPPREAQMTASSPSPGGETRPATHQPARGAVAAPARAPARAKKKQRCNSVMSAEHADDICHARRIFIVYYDSHVQSFFDDLVRFVSSSRNLMRKAKMAAKVAQVKRMAELEIAHDAKRTNAERFAVDALPSSTYMTARRPGPIANDQTSTEPSQPGGADEPGDVYDSIDKSLEFVQSACEHSAHQFLRDGDCYDEMRKIQARLGEVLQESRREIERSQRQDAELARETGQNMGMTGRVHRSVSVRRHVAVGHEDETMVVETENSLAWDIAPAATLAPGPSAMLEVDPNLDDDDLDDLMPKLQYRSTRLMRSGAV